MAQSIYELSAQVYQLGFEKVFPKLNRSLLSPTGKVDAEFAQRFEKLYRDLTGKSWQDGKFFKPVSLLARYDPDAPGNSKQRYFPVRSLFADGLHYPDQLEGSASEGEIEALEEELKKELDALPTKLSSKVEPRLRSRINRLLAEKYLSAVGVAVRIDSYVEPEYLPLYDILQLCAAILSQPEGTKFYLATLDISGIQDFAYNISNSKALLSLRGRSIFLEIVSRTILYELLEAADATDDCLLIPGGGYYSLLLPAHKKDLASELDKIVQSWNANLFHWQEGRLAAIFAMSDENNLLELSDLTQRESAVYQKAREDISSKLQTAKWHKFSHLLTAKELSNQPPGEPCSICRRHVHGNKLKLLDNPNGAENTVEAEIKVCDLCHFLIQLGKHIKEAIGNNQRITFDATNGGWTLNKATVEASQLANPLKKVTIALNPSIASALVDTDVEIRLAFSDLSEDKTSTGNNKTGNKAKDSKISSETPQVNLEDLDNVVPEEGWQGQAAIRADVDNLGSLLHQNLKEMPLVGLISLSRLLTLFFSTYVMRLDNGTPKVHQFRLKNNGIVPDPTPRKFHIIYGGGDDLFGLGSWDDVVEFALDVGREWRKFTGFNQHVTLSAGVHLHDKKYPVSVRAYDSGKMLDKAKENIRPGKRPGDKPEREKDSLYLGLARKPIFWGDLLRVQENTGLNPTTQPKPTAITTDRIYDAFLFPLYRLLDKSAVPRSFVRKLLEADREMHDNEGKNLPQGKVSLLYLLASCREREILSTHKNQQWRNDWAHVYDFLRDIHQTPQPPELLLYLNWLDLAARPPRIGKDEENGKEEE